MKGRCWRPLQDSRCRDDRKNLSAFHAHTPPFTFDRGDRRKTVNSLKTIAVSETVTDLCENKEKQLFRIKSLEPDQGKGSARLNRNLGRQPPLNTHIHRDPTNPTTLEMECKGRLKIQSIQNSWPFFKKPREGRLRRTDFKQKFG